MSSAAQTAAWGEHLAKRKPMPHLDRLALLHAPQPNESEQERKIRVGLAYTD